LRLEASSNASTRVGWLEPQRTPHPVKKPSETERSRWPEAASKAVRGVDTGRTGGLAFARNDEVRHGPVVGHSEGQVNRAHAGTGGT